jgi:hypothetical protein
MEILVPAHALNGGLYLYPAIAFANETAVHSGYVHQQGGKDKGSARLHTAKACSCRIRADRILNLVKTLKKERVLVGHPS